MEWERPLTFLHQKKGELFTRYLLLLTRYSLIFTTYSLFFSKFSLLATFYSLLVTCYFILAVVTRYCLLQSLTKHISFEEVITAIDCDLGLILLGRFRSAWQTTQKTSNMSLRRPRWDYSFELVGFTLSVIPILYRAHWKFSALTTAW